MLKITSYSRFASIVYFDEKNKLRLDQTVKRGSIAGAYCDLNSVILIEKIQSHLVR